MWGMNDLYGQSMQSGLTYHAVFRGISSTHTQSQHAVTDASEHDNQRSTTQSRTGADAWYRITQKTQQWRSSQKPSRASHWVLWLMPLPLLNMGIEPSCAPGKLCRASTRARRFTPKKANKSLTFPQALHPSRHQAKISAAHPLTDN
eukprot:3641951-Amphidinium_carterae.1